jgi:L-threonylcarbamoyladenylate synthase
VLAELDGRIPLILDGGPCAIGLESTVIDTTTPTPRILRPGAVTADMLREVIGHVETVAATVSPEAVSASPGQHASHYAPRTPAFRFVATQWPLPAPAAPIALLTWSDAIHLPAPHETLRLPATPDDYARVIYAALRDADDKKLSAIYVLMPPHDNGLWAAIADRLTRATRPLTTDH